MAKRFRLGRFHSFFLWILILGVGGSLFLLWIIPVPVRAYHWIRLGMTPREVEAAVGTPPGNYTGTFILRGTGCGPYGECVWETGVPSSSALQVIRTGEQVQGWYWKDYWLRVVYDEHRRVVHYSVLEVTADMDGKPRQSWFHPFLPLFK